MQLERLSSQLYRLASRQAPLPDKKLSIDCSMVEGDITRHVQPWLQKKVLLSERRVPKVLLEKEYKVSIIQMLLRLAKRHEDRLEILFFFG